MSNYVETLKYLWEREREAKEGLIQSLQEKFKAELEKAFPMLEVVSIQIIDIIEENAELAIDLNAVFINGSIQFKEKESGRIISVDMDYLGSGEMKREWITIDDDDYSIQIDGEQSDSEEFAEITNCDISVVANAIRKVYDGNLYGGE